MFFTKGVGWTVKSQGAASVEVKDDRYVELVTAQRNGQELVVSAAGVPSVQPFAALTPQAPTFTPRQVIETLFTPAEQQALYTAAQAPAGWQISKFISLVTAASQVSIADPEFVADIETIQAAGLLTAARAAQVLAGTPPSTS